MKKFVITPDQKQLVRRPSTIARALLRGRGRVKRELEEEFRPILMTSTTGRSAESVPFLYTAHDIARLKTAGFRMMALAGARSTDRLFSMFPFAPHLAFWQTHYACHRIRHFPIEFGRWVKPSAPTATSVSWAKSIRTCSSACRPLSIMSCTRRRWTASAAENLRSLVLGGEKVPPGLRRKLHELAAQLGAPSVNVISTYGFTEAKFAWCECLFPVEAESAGYHLYPDLGIVEVIDPQTGEVRADGEPGEIVFTSLDARGSCVLRYRTGDIVEGGLTYEPCPHCGRIVPRARRKISRRSDVREDAA